MILDQEKFDQSRDKDEIECKCDYCGELFFRKKKYIRRLYKTTITKKDACPKKECNSSKKEDSNLVTLGVRNPMQDKQIQEKTKQTMLEKLGVEYAMQSNEVKEKAQKTNNDKLGVNWVFQNKGMRNKSENTNLIKRGVKNAMQSQEVQDILKEKINLLNKENPKRKEQIETKRRKTTKKNHGVEHPMQNKEIIKKSEEKNLSLRGVKNAMQSKEVQSKAKQTCIELYGKFPVNNFGKTQKEIQDYLNSFNYNFQPNYSILNGKELDLYDESLNLAIEYNGLHWHCEDSPNPRDKYYHYNKYKDCLSKDVRLIMIYEDEWLNRKEQVKNLLKSVLNIYDKKVFGRKCIIKEIDKQIVNQFYEQYHIQGKVQNIKASYGIYYNDELLGCISLGLHHRNNKELVLNRLCFKDGVQVVGGSSKLFKHCIQYAKKVGFDKIISWSDNRWSQGNVYYKLDFVLDKELNPDYSYVNIESTKQKRYSKQSCKKKDIDCPKGKTEKEWMNELGYSRIWDCGKKRWIYEIQTISSLLKTSLDTGSGYFEYN